MAVRSEEPDPYADACAVRPEGGSVHVWHAQMARRWMARAHDHENPDAAAVAQWHATMAVYEALIEPGTGASVGELAERVAFGG